MNPKDDKTPHASPASRRGRVRLLKPNLAEGQPISSIYIAPILGTHKTHHPTAISVMFEFELPFRRG